MPPEAQFPMSRLLARHLRIPLRPWAKPQARVHLRAQPQRPSLMATHRLPGRNRHPRHHAQATILLLPRREWALVRPTFLARVTTPSPALRAWVHALARVASLGPKHRDLVKALVLAPPVVLVVPVVPVVRVVPVVPVELAVLVVSAVAQRAPVDSAPREQARLLAPVVPVRVDAAVVLEEEPLVPSEKVAERASPASRRPRNAPNTNYARPRLSEV